MLPSKLKRQKILRLIASMSGYAFALVTLLAGAFIGLSRGSASAPVGRGIWIGLAILFVVAVTVVACQASAEYRRRTHDPTWVLHYQSMFDRMSKQRCSAANTLTEQKGSLGKFQDEVGTLVGEISFPRTDDPNREARVQFQAPVYLTNINRMGIVRPPSFKYDAAFEVEGTNYERRVQISHTLQPGEADRFTVKVAVARSSYHRFRATLRDVSGLVIQSLPIEMNCFVPRFRRNAVEKALSSTQAR